MISDLVYHAGRLASASNQPEDEDLANAYADWITAAVASPLWSSDHRMGLRIPWRLFKAADASSDWSEAFGSAGLYLWGSAAGIPLYIGKAGVLRARLKARYVGRADNQCPLAAKYESELLMHGLDGLPPDYWERWQSRAQHGQMTIPRGAVAFARHGIDGIWFTLLPIAEPERVNPLEKRLIMVANTWNRQRGYPPLLNERDA